MLNQFFVIADKLVQSDVCFGANSLCFFNLGYDFSHTGGGISAAIDMR